MISRDLDRATAEPYDLIVVGAGIYGSTLALEAARRGLRPMLLERDDFGQHTSWNSLRILHGGLRYLQTMNLRRFVESVGERTWFLKHFPALVRPFPFLMPLYGEGLRRSSVLSVALAANDLLSRRRNHQVDRDRAIPPGKVLTPAEVVERFAGIEPNGLEGGALWYDAVMEQPQRVIMEVLRWASARGAVALNHVSADGVEVSEGEVRGVLGVDQLTGRRLRFRAPVVVGCCGPWGRAFARRADRDFPSLFRPSLALNVLLDCAPEFDVGLALEAGRPGGRTYFLCPREGGVLAGTYHAPLQDSHALPETSHGIVGQLVHDFVSQLQLAAPGLEIGEDSVRRVFWGHLPVRTSGTVDLAPRELIHDHSRGGGPRGLFSVSGVKFTMARRVAERVLRLMARRGFVNRLDPAEDGPPLPVVPPPLSPSGGSDDDEQRLSSFIRRLVEEESVQTAEDVLLRRTDWGVLASDVETHERIAHHVRRAVGSSE